MRLSMRIILVVFAICISVGCANKDKKECKKKLCPPKSIKECTTRVIDNLGRPASTDPFVDMNHDGHITGMDFTICREQKF